MRLKNPEQQFSANSDGASVEILDQILGITESKRARSTSSLDIKVTNGEQLIRPPKQSKKSARARSSAAARNKLDFSDLEGMTEEEIMQALYDDPELAAAATAAAEEMQKAKKQKMPPKPKSSRRNRVLSEHPDHIRAMMDEGIPIKQWIILIVLLGAGLYQLRKSLVGSKKTAAAAATKKVVKLVGGRKGTKKTKKGLGGWKATKRSRSDAAVCETASSPIERDFTFEEQAPPAVAASPKKSATKKRKARNQKAAINKPYQHPAKDTMSHESPDSASTDGSSSTDAGATQHDDALRADDIEDIGSKDIVIDTTTAESSPDDGWQTVGAPTMTESPQLEKFDSSTTPTAAEPVKAVEETPVQAKSSGKDEENAKKQNGVIKAISNATAKGKTTSKNDGTDVLDNDEAFAFKLQLEEEKLAKHEANKTSSPDVWEEVSIKKKGKR